MRTIEWQSMAAALALSVSVTGAVAAGGGKGKGSNGAYIVQLADMPVSAYQGELVGYNATAPRKGQKIDPLSGNVVSYKAYLEARHDRALASVGGGRKLYSYGYVFNGFAAELTADQAAKLAAQPGVRSVTKDEIRRHDTATTPSLLSLSGSTGFWESTRRVAKTSSSASSIAASGRSTRASATAPTSTGMPAAAGSSATSRFPAGMASASRAKRSPAPAATRS
jgi:hypothetical protein